MGEVGDKGTRIRVCVSGNKVAMYLGTELIYVSRGVSAEMLARKLRYVGLSNGECREFEFEELVEVLPRSTRKRLEQALVSAHA